MFTNIAGKEGLVIGGGRTAFGKVRRLLSFGPVLKVVAPEFCPELLEMCRDDAKSHQLNLVCREFSKEDIADDLAFVIAASDHPEVNRLAASVCDGKRIPVNVVDVPGECSFFFPSLVQRGRLTIGISTGGASPSAAIYLRKKIEQTLDDGIGDILDYMAKRRDAVREAFPREKLRKEAYGKMFQKCLELGRPLEPEEEAEILFPKISLP